MGFSLKANLDKDFLRFAKKCCFGLCGFGGKRRICVNARPNGAFIAVHNVSSSFPAHQDGQGYLEELVRDMVSWLSSSSGLKPERCLQSNGLLTTLSQHYFLFLGTLSAHPQGVKLLEKCGLFQW